METYTAKFRDITISNTNIFNALSVLSYYYDSLDEDGGEWQYKGDAWADIERTLDDIMDDCSCCWDCPASDYSDDQIAQLYHENKDQCDSALAEHETVTDDVSIISRLPYYQREAVIAYGTKLLRVDADKFWEVFESLAAEFDDGLPYNPEDFDDYDPY